MLWHCHYGWVLTAGGVATDRGLVLVVLTLAGHNNLPLVKQVSSWQNHYCLHMVMRTREGRGNRFWEGWSWAMAWDWSVCVWGSGGLGRRGSGPLVCSLASLSTGELSKLPQYKLARLKNRSHWRGGKTDDKPEDLTQKYNVPTPSSAHIFLSEHMIMME